MDNQREYPTLEAANEHLKGLEYRPGVSIRAWFDPEEYANSVYKYTLHVHITCPDVKNVTRNVEVGISVPVRTFQLSWEDVSDQLYAAVSKIEMHEVTEWLRHSGKPLINPHPIASNDTD